MYLRASRAFASSYIHLIISNKYYENNNHPQTTRRMAAAVPAHTIQGVKVEGELKPGIYIRNGKKFVVK